jgi:uncharacterized protein YndB with AHSA1/START domain
MKPTILTFLGFLALLAAIGAMLPSKYELEREITISSDAPGVFAHIRDLRLWESWMPWSEQDDTLRITPGEVSQGVGATQSWVGKDGTGSLEITGVEENKFLEYDIFFGDSDKEKSSGVARARIDLDNNTSGSTKVVWGMSGEIKLPVIGGYFALYMNRLAGSMFDQGLRNLKEVVETGAQEALADDNDQTVPSPL